MQMMTLSKLKSRMMRSCKRCQHKEGKTSLIKFTTKFFLRNLSCQIFRYLGQILKIMTTFWCNKFLEKIMEPIIEVKTCQLLRVSSTRLLFSLKTAKDFPTSKTSMRKNQPTSQKAIASLVLYSSTKKAPKCSKTTRELKSCQWLMHQLDMNSWMQISSFLTSKWTE